MKKNLIRSILSLILSVLIFSGCKKITGEEMQPVNVVEDQSSGRDDHGKCRLRSMVQSDGFNESFQYNNKGLANRWLIDYGDGTTYDYRITYDRNDRLKSSRMIFDGDAVKYTFHNNGNRTTRLTGFLESTGEPYADIHYSYNHRGQMTRLDDIVADIHSRFYYDNQGNTNRVDLYVGTELFYTYILTFTIPNKNPYLAVNGVDFGFTSNFFLASFFDKRWNSTGKFIIYDNGNPVVVADDDPVQTVIHTGRGNFVTYAGYYDIVNESSYDLRFEYENCGRNNGYDKETKPASAVPGTTAMSMKTKLKKIFDVRSKNMKQDLMHFKMQCIAQQKPVKGK